MTSQANPDRTVFCLYATHNGKPAGFCGRYRTREEAVQAKKSQRGSTRIKRERVSAEDYARWSDADFMPRGWIAA